MGHDAPHEQQDGGKAAHPFGLPSLRCLLPEGHGVPVREKYGEKAGEMPQHCLTCPQPDGTRLSMDPVEAQYEAYPYPARDPADEARRLVTGSPSDPLEIDHFGYGGARDWSQPFRVLIAGGGTGDALVMLAQRCRDAGVPVAITYLDLSISSRKIAEARIAARKLSGVEFITGSLLEAAELGSFDYIDCCGVLHHLPDPQAGFDALAAALAPGGVLGAMVYAPLGRSGVYPLQAALATLTAHMTPQDKVATAKQVLATLPESHPFSRNMILGDHQRSDAGLYDLLLHARDMPFTADAVMKAVETSGLRFAGFVPPSLYDPATWAGGTAIPDSLDAAQRAALAEQLCGAIKTHVFYAVNGPVREAKPRPEAVPRLRTVQPGVLAQQAASGKAIMLKRDGTEIRLRLPRQAAPILRLLDGRRPLGAVAQAARLDWLAFSSLYRPVHDALTGHGLLFYSIRFA
jgi:SAM-dependent methyltransferase